MVYVALLRGINVGGNAKVEMSKLKLTFESLGCQEVSTYINSGNVIFGDKRTSEKLIALIEAAIIKDFGINVRVVLRNKANIEAICKKVPKSWANDNTQRTDVLFLWDEIDDKDVLQKVAINPEIENILYLRGALVWNISRQNVTRGAGVKLIKTEIYKHMTARNINTVRKLNELMSVLK